MPLLVQQMTVTLSEIDQRGNLTIIIVEQNVPVLGMAQRRIILEKRHVVARGSPDEISDGDLGRQHFAI